ncbi:MAG: DEAD/DEAH box helicase [Acidimicrobiales bacterium]
MVVDHWGWPGPKDLRLSTSVAANGVIAQEGARAHRGRLMGADEQQRSGQKLRQAEAAETRDRVMADQSGLANAIEHVLRQTPGATAKTVARELGAAKRVVNQALYANPRRFRHDKASVPRWWLTSALDQARAEPDWGSRAVTAVLPEPYRWQSDALEAWRAQCRRGVVEAVTGAGKTAVGLHAAREALEANTQVVVLVPTIVLQKQWLMQFRKQLPGASVGRLGGEHREDLRSRDVLVSVVNTGRTTDFAPLRPGLLIADEVHRYGTEFNAQALDERFGSRLGLSATYARDDDGVDALLAPYFGPSCYRLGYAEAIADGVLSPYRVGLVGIEMNRTTTIAYKHLTDILRSERGALERAIGFSDPFAEFMVEVERIIKGEREGPAESAGRYLATLSDRRTLLAEAPERFAAFAAVAPALRQSQRSIVFGERVDQAEQLARTARAAGIDATAIHSGLSNGDRERRLDEFRRGRVAMIVAPRVLDEGVDVPEADLGVVVSTSRSRRQMIQRMGRVLRRKSDGRRATFVLFYLEGTVEDPAAGAHEEFLAEVLECAEQSVRFDGTWNAEDLARWVAGSESRE